MFNPYSAGAKHYGGGRMAPNLGPTSTEGALGYSQRDARTQARKNAVLRRMQRYLTGDYANPDVRRWQ